MQTQYLEKYKKLTILLLVAPVPLLLNLGMPLSLNAAAPNRSIPYDEANLCASADVFFCEDWEADSIIIPKGSGGNDNTCLWKNPAVSNRNGKRPANLDCGTAQGGSVQHPAVNLPIGPDTTSQNRVWRMTKGGSAPNDIVTGVNTGSGQAGLRGFLRDTKGNGIKGIREYYVRYFYRYNQGYDFPEQYDSKQVFTQPLNFLDNPSANYQNGANVIRRRCQGIPVPAENAFMLRHSGPYDQFPTNNAEGNCTTAHGTSDGMLPTGQIKLNHYYKWDHNWHEVEYYFKLESSLSGNSNDGDMRLWIDGTLLYEQLNTDVCRGGCEDLGFIFAGAYMSPNDKPHAGFAEMDNLVLSRKKIGSTSGGPTPPTTDTTPPNNPSGLSLKLNVTTTP